MGVLVDAPPAEPCCGSAGGVEFAKAKEAPAPPPRMHVSYDSLHQAITSSLGALKEAGWQAPDYLIAISGGGLIPARILRSVLRRDSKQGSCAAKVIGLELYNDEMDGQPHAAGVKRTQWLEAGSTPLVGKRVLVVDEVDDSRATLAYAVRELQADIAAEAAALQAAGQPVADTQLGVYVIHNKQREKVGQLPEGVPEFVAQEVAGNPWIVYPWDAPDIEEHNLLGRLNSGSSNSISSSE